MDDLNADENIEKIYDILEERGRILERQGTILEQQQGNIQRLILTLKGDDYGNRGYKHRIKNNEDSLEEVQDDIRELNKTFSNITNRVIGITVGISIAFSVLTWFVKTASLGSAKPLKSIDSINRIEDQPVSDPIPSYLYPLEKARQNSTKVGRNED